MSEERKTFKVTCAHCARPFHVRFALARPDEPGSGDVVVTCLYCNKNVAVTVPRVYIPERTALRSIPAQD